MKMRASSDSFLFEEFRLDRAGGGLFRRHDHGVFVPVAVGSRALDILGLDRTAGWHCLKGRDHGRRLAQHGGRGG